MPISHFQKGINHLNSGNYSQAIFEFDKAKKQKPDDFKTFLYRSSENIELGNFDDAIGDMEKIV